MKLQPTKDSENIYHFLEKLPAKLRVRPIVPDTETTKILKQWLEQLTEIHSHQNSSKPLTVEILTILPQPPLTFWNWIPQSIRNEEIPKLRHFIKTTFEIEHPQLPSQLRTIQLYISSMTPFKNTEFIQRIQIAVQLLTNYAPTPCHNSPLDIYIYLTKAKKTLPSETGQIMDENHANTAFTTSCDMNSMTPSNDFKKESKYIILFREEEVFKVLLHELFHVLGLDFSHDSIATQKTANFIREHFQINLPEIRLFETYCETWATVIHCLILTFLKHTSSSTGTSIVNSPDKMIQNFFRIFSYEQNFVLFQCAKILHYHQLSYHQFSQTKKGGTKKKRGGKKGKNSKTRNRLRTPETYRENTQVFCYYILKSAVFQNIPSFLQQFPPPFSIEESQQFAKFVQKCFLDSNFEKKLHFYTAIFKHTKTEIDIQPLCIHPQPLDQKICETMRQTATEISLSS